MYRDIKVITSHNTVTQTHLRWPAKGDNVSIKTGQSTLAHRANCTMIYKWAEVWCVPDRKGWAGGI